MAGIRTFIAVSISEESRQALSQMISDLKGLASKVRWVPPENLHLTLKFLGQVDESRLPDIKQSLERSADGLKPFDYYLSGVGCFPNCRRPRVLWVGAEEDDDQLFRLRDQIEEQFAAIDFPKEKRKFHPHLTLARIKDSRNLGELLHAFQNYDFGKYKVHVSKVTLMKSELNPKGARYSPLYDVSIT